MVELTPRCAHVLCADLRIVLLWITVLLPLRGADTAVELAALAGVDCHVPGKCST